MVQRSDVCMQERGSVRESVYVHVCVREREKERERKKGQLNYE